MLASSRALGAGACCKAIARLRSSESLRPFSTTAVAATAPAKMDDALASVGNQQLIKTTPNVGSGWGQDLGSTYEVLSMLCIAAVHFGMLRMHCNAAWRKRLHALQSAHLHSSHACLNSHG